MSHTVIKRFAEINVHLESIGRSWRFSHLDLEESRYMYDWITTARQFLGISLKDFSLALPDSEQGEHVFARNEWNYIDRYLTNITSASGNGKLYDLPSDLVCLTVLSSFSSFALLPVSRQQPFIGNLQFRYTGVKYLSTLMVRFYHSSELPPS